MLASWLTDFSIVIDVRELRCHSLTIEAVANVAGSTCELTSQPGSVAHKYPLYPWRA